MTAGAPSSQRTTPPPAPVKTQAQRRAAHALAAVRRIQAGAPKPKELSRFRAYAQKLPAMVQSNGLGQMAAFCRSRVGKESERAYVELYDILSDWLTGDGQPYCDPEKDLLVKITESSMGEYRAAQREALAYLDWVKRFAMAFLVEGTASDPTADADARETGGGDA